MIRSQLILDADDGLTSAFSRARCRPDAAVVFTVSLETLYCHSHIHVISVTVIYCWGSNQYDRSVPVLTLFKIVLIILILMAPNDIINTNTVFIISIQSSDHHHHHVSLISVRRQNQYSSIILTDHPLYDHDQHDQHVNVLILIIITIIIMWHI